MVVDKKSQNIFLWIEWIVTSNLPFSFVDNEMTRINTQNTRETISRTTVMKYMDQLGYEIEEVLSRILPDRFALAFDGWDNGNSTNYCGVFVMWYDAEKKKDHIYLLRLAPLLRPHCLMKGRPTLDKNPFSVSIWESAPKSAGRNRGARRSK